MDRIAEELGTDPLDFRLENHVGPEGQPGERVTPPDQMVDTQPVEGGVPFSSNGLRECLVRGAEAIGWRDRSVPAEPTSPKKTGYGMSMFIYRGGPGGKSSARLRLNQDGSVQLEAGLMDVGEGSMTVMAQIAAEELSIPYGQVHTTFGDTQLTPQAPITAGSTATFSTGLAVKEAAARLKSKILDVAASAMGTETDRLEISHGTVFTAADPERRLSLSELAAAVDGPLETEASITPGSKDYIVNSFGAHFAEVEVDTETGQVRVLRYVAAHDSGRILNPNLAVNQVEGGVAQMLGFSLTEQMLTDSRSGALLNASYLEHKSPTIMEIPQVEVIFADVVDPVGPYGAKALGEPPSIGVAPAVVNAIYDAIGTRIKELPVTPDRILNAIALKQAG
jgi:CO/xanthine dehydrogenase Mo-binding subunit